MLLFVSPALASNGSALNCHIGIIDAHGLSINVLQTMAIRLSSRVNHATGSITRAPSEPATTASDAMPMNRPCSTTPGIACNA